MLKQWRLYYLKLAVWNPDGGSSTKGDIPQAKNLDFGFRISYIFFSRFFYF
jgi:hypothetical protein